MFDLTKVQTGFRALLLASVVVAGTPSFAGSPSIDASDATFNEAVKAVKDKDYRHAMTLFTLQAENHQHDAQYNLALLLEAGKGAPQDFVSALDWAWTAQLGGIADAKELADDLNDILPEVAIAAVRESVSARLQSRIDAGDAAAIPQFAAYQLTILEEPNYETAYIWYSIGAALGLKGTLEARDDSRENIEDETIIKLQAEAGTIYESLNVNLD
tara:strand:+ start:359 stop:1003 length:645 start_codon:yes stop_codon:yes gene_type:complete